MQPVEVQTADPLVLAVAAAHHVVGGPALRGSLMVAAKVETITEFRLDFHVGTGPLGEPCWFFADICGNCHKMIGIECQCAEADPVSMASSDAW